MSSEQASGARVVDPFDLPALLKEFDKYRRAWLSSGGDPEPFRMPLFSRNPAKRFVVKQKYRIVTSILKRTGPRGTALDFGPGFGAFLPVLSTSHSRVTAVDIFPDQLAASRGLCDHLGLKNVSVVQVRPLEELRNIASESVDTVMVTDVLEHVRHWQQTIEEINRICRPGALVMVSIPREHILYRMFARKEVEHDETRGHVYHSSEGADLLEERFKAVFRLVYFKSLYSFFHILVLRKPESA